MISNNKILFILLKKVIMGWLDHHRWLGVAMAIRGGPTTPTTKLKKYIIIIIVGPWGWSGHPQCPN
jgi:hypothetical protein